MTDQANYRDFTKKRPEVFFDLNGERFDCVKAIAPKKLQRAINAFRGIQEKAKAGVSEGNVGELLERVASAMIFFLKSGDNYERFEKMINDEDADEPIDVFQLVEILTWLLGDVYGARPTKPSSDSTTTSPSDGTGTSSTAGVPLEESNPSNSLSHVS